MKANIFIKIFRFFILKFFYALTIFVGIFSSKLKDKFRYFFIKLNNFITANYKNRKKDLKILILLPHCLQNNDCLFRITKDINNCKKCGKCVIADFVDLQEQTKIPVSVVTGGTLARKAVRENHPDIIIACACERDLASGIYDSYPFLVYGVLNDRPNGPCINTNIDIDVVKKYLNKIKFVKAK